MPLCIIRHICLNVESNNILIFNLICDNISVTICDNISTKEISHHNWPLEVHGVAVFYKETGHNLYFPPLIHYS